MQTIAICEDEDYWQEQLRTILDEIKIDEELDIHTFRSGEDFLKDYTYGSYDLIFMDIYMNGMNGVDAVNAIRLIDPDVCIAFTTTSLDHALEGYRLNVMRYLEKPIKKKDVLNCLELVRLNKDYRKQITLLISGKERLFDETQIVYLEQKGHSILLYLVNEASISFTGKLDDLVKNFPMPPFYRCHKSFLVNLGQVDLINKELMVFTMKNGNNVYIRRGNMKEAETVLDDYLFQTL